MTEKQKSDTQSFSERCPQTKNDWRLILHWLWVMRHLPRWKLLSWLEKIAEEQAR